jgi:hypothetical protein
LSAEFVLPSPIHADDAEIIQFLSGLEINEDRQEVVLAYGINDCEAAITTVDLATVTSMLRPVPDRKQVVDYMRPLQTAVTR